MLFSDKRLQRDKGDEQYTKMPFYGVEKMTAWLKAEGYLVNVKRIRRLMRKITRASGTPHEVYFCGNNNNHNDGDAYRIIHQIQPIFCLDNGEGFSFIATL